MRLIDADWLKSKMLLDKKILNDFAKDLGCDNRHEYSLDIMIDCVEKAPTVMQWTGVEDRLPKDNLDLLLTDGKSMTVGSRWEGKFYDNAHHEFFATYWSILPSFPKNKNSHSSTRGLLI